MSEERLEHSIALVLARWMGGENLKKATSEVARIARLYYENKEAPKLFVIKTPKEEVSVTAIDFQDAVQTWVKGGGHPTDILAIESYHETHETHTEQTVY